MDVHVPWAMTIEWRLRGVHVVTAQEDGAGQFKDPILLDRAAAQGRVLVTPDTDFLREAARRHVNSRLASVSVSPFCAESPLLRRVLEERVGHSDAGNDLSVVQVFA